MTAVQPLRRAERVTLEAMSNHEMVANIQAIHRAIAPFIVVDP